jgi:hypothetical protein
MPELSHIDPRTAVLLVMDYQVDTLTKSMTAAQSADVIACMPDLIATTRDVGMMVMQNLILEIWREQKFTAILVTHDVQEAVALGDRVIVLERGAIGQELIVPLPHPRDIGTPEFAALEDTILRWLLQQS